VNGKNVDILLELRSIAFYCIELLCLKNNPFDFLSQFLQLKKDFQFFH